MLKKCEVHGDSKPVIMLVKSAKHYVHTSMLPTSSVFCLHFHHAALYHIFNFRPQVFGVYASQGLKRTRTRSYIGDRECFLFSLKPTEAKYGWQVSVHFLEFH
jgi:hypothetical protein